MAGPDADVDATLLPGLPASGLSGIFVNR